VVEGDWAGSEKDEGEGESSQSEREFVSALTGQSIVEMYLPDCDAHIDANGKGRYTGKKSEQHQDAAEKLGKGGEVTPPPGKSQAGYEVGVVLEPAEDLVIPVGDHNGSEDKAHDQQRERL